MNLVTAETKIIDLSNALPSEWQHLSAGQVSIFNPTLLDDNGTLVIAYRVVGLVDGLRRIATAKLDNDFQIIPGSALPFSDFIEFANPDGLDADSKIWFADPRFFRFNNSVWLMWNNGHVDGINKQFLIEVSADGTHPIGKARELVLAGARRKTEKNWSFFENSDGVFAVYSVTPHRIIKADFSSPLEIKCHLVSEIDWSAKYSEVYGALRGGAAPIQIGDKFLNLAHSSYLMPWGREYVPAVYEFEVQYPFKPTDELATPIFVPDVKHKTLEETQDSLNSGTSRVVYPSGAIVRGDDLIFSIGINDHEMGISRTSLSAVKAESQRVAALRVTAYDYTSASQPVSPNLEIPVAPSVPVFWWDATGQVMTQLNRHNKFVHGNFGDEASHELIDLLGPIKARKVRPGDAKLLAIGSILHRMAPGDLVWGSGIKHPEALDAIPVSDVEITAVRGPLTLEALQRNGWDTSGIKEMFDPGVLLAKIFEKQLAAYDRAKNDVYGPVRFIPHFRDELVLRRNYPNLATSFLTVDCRPLDMLKRMLGAEKVISSSLHGVIFAESLGIPAVWLASPGGEGTYKFSDYYASTDRAHVKVCETAEDALRATPPELPKMEFDKWQATFPAESIARLANVNPLPTAQPFPDADTSSLTGLHWSSEFSRNLEGLWLLGHDGVIGLAPIRVPDDAQSVTISIRPRRLIQNPSHQNIDLHMGGCTARIHWAPNDISIRTVTLTPSVSEWAAGVRIHVRYDGVEMKRKFLRGAPQPTRNLCINKVEVNRAED